MLAPMSLGAPAVDESSEQLRLQVCFTEKNALRELRAEKKAGTSKPSIQDYHLVKILGEGAFAKVVLAREKLTGKIFAMKVIHKSKITLSDEDTRAAVSPEDVAYRKMYLVK